ncbi:MAG: M13 family metallopeptidase [Lachnospiraceae bacterium]|nr:M13 family metallopeptidase [Lachnospiraceae bacterium]
MPQSAHRRLVMKIFHAFDTSGAQFDKNGNYDDWQEESDYEASQAVNDELEKGEMIADLGGMKAALMMLQDIEISTMMHSFGLQKRDGQ